MIGPFLLGLSVGLLIAALFLLGFSVRYVASDLEGFRRWLDHEGAL